MISTILKGFPIREAGSGRVTKIVLVSLQVDFDHLVAETEAARRQSAARDARRAAIAQQRLAEVHSEMTGTFWFWCCSYQSLICYLPM